MPAREIDTVRIPLHSQTDADRVRAYAVVDAYDAHHAEHRWCLHAGRHAVRDKPMPDGSTRPVNMRLELLGLTRGDGFSVEHIDGDWLNLRRSNLQVTKLSPAAPSSSATSGTSGYRGVSWDKRSERWRATTRIDGRVTHLGYFEDEEKAAYAAGSSPAQHRA